ncbi:Protein kinase-like domain [Phytophthora cactorum]|nr:Protein kinase-like domain [Phytophthora cactorum]
MRNNRFEFNSENCANRSSNPRAVGEANPRDQVLTQDLLSKGAFGEVYAGTFNGRKVAVKMLLPASREKLHRVNKFLAEAKMTATMDHPTLYPLLGLPGTRYPISVLFSNIWTEESCYEEDKHPVGFDLQKLTIALQVCRVLSYLHSLMPSVIHRDLKSRNILLDSEMKAKLSDFGISRERLDRTMTAGVGTSLWMAPEVMLGERYDDKVDMFSFGVVLSELDVHTRPYARVKKDNLDSNGREMTDSVLLQKVALGQVQVEFSKASPKAVVELGQACISIDPTQRPSAAEAAYRLQSILTRKVRSPALVALMVKVATANKLFAIQATYLGDQCGGTPYAITVYEDENCTATACDSYDLFYGSRSINANMMTNDCSSNYSELLQIMRDKLATLRTCFRRFTSARTVPSSPWLSGTQQRELVSVPTTSPTVCTPSRVSILTPRLLLNCTSKEPALPISSTWRRLCLKRSSRLIRVLSIGSDGTAATTPRSRTEARQPRLKPYGKYPQLRGARWYRFRCVWLCSGARRCFKYDPYSLDSLEAVLRGQTGLWNDDVITAKRIPRDKVLTKKLISRGSFGEVYVGTFNERKVAVKVLLPSMRGKIQHVNDFLAEAKMTAVMDHPHVVSFIGVAWDSLSDICVVLEYMDGGELRGLLDKFEKDKHPIGFTSEKTTIALEVCHALTYLHSLSPSIIHRDLKSRNILLNSEMKAKLSDFGISRERLDRTMTAGVGTSLWMAPEVMLGERYDDKADVFSFGVVLSELDVHTLPYARAKKRIWMRKATRYLTQFYSSERKLGGNRGAWSSVYVSVPDGTPHRSRGTLQTSNDSVKEKDFSNSIGYRFKLTEQSSLRRARKREYSRSTKASSS